jgi:hypothetical protein
MKLPQVEIALAMPGMTRRMHIVERSGKMNAALTGSVDQDKRIDRVSDLRRASANNLLYRLT